MTASAEQTSGRASEVMSSHEIAEFSGWWILSLVLTILAVVVLSVTLFSLESCGSVAGTVIERKTFENSYQNSEARKSEIATFEAQLAELDALLSDSTLTPSQCAQLEGQRRALNIQLSRAREQLDNVYLK